MGNQNQPAKQNPQKKGNEQIRESQMDDDEDFYLLEEINKLSLKGNRTYIYYWIDPKIFNNQNMKYSTYLRKSIDLQGFSSIEGMYNALSEQPPDKKTRIICAASLKEEDYQNLQNNPQIPNMFLFCQNQERAHLLKLNFPKIKIAKFDINELKDAILQTQVQESETDPKTNILFMIEDDTNLLNKYRLNYHCLTSNNSITKAKDDYVKFVTQLYPQQKAEVQLFKTQYKIGLSPQQKATQAMQWCFMNNFYWDSIQTLPKTTTDPKKLAYLRQPFKDVHEAILKKFKTQPKSLHEVYLVLELKEDQKKLFDENVDNFIAFTSFVKGYTTQKKANQHFKKSKNNFLFRVMLSKNKKDDSLDFGFYVEKGVEKGPDILFNIYNFFRIDDFETEIREATLSYGALAQLSYKRQFQRAERLTPHEERLIRNFDYIEDVMKNVNGQAKVLQISGHLKDSLTIYTQKIEHIRKSQPSKEVIERHMIEMGDAYRINEDYEKAEAEYKKVTTGGMKTIALVHLAELYMKTKKNDKLESLLSQIQMGVSVLDAKNKPQAFKARNFIGVSLMNKGKLKDAQKQFDSLMREAAEYYDYRYEGIPLVHDIMNNMATCKTKLNQFSQALSLLDSTKNWQKGCEGNRSPNLLVTQNLIKSVHESRGEKNLIRESEIEIAKIKETVSPGEIKYLKNTMIFPPDNLDQSQINIHTSVNVVNSGNIKESAINIYI